MVNCQCKPGASILERHYSLQTAGVVFHYHVRAHLERSAQGPGAGAQHGPSMDSVTKVQRRYELVRALLLAVAYLNSPLAAARLVEQ